MYKIIFSPKSQTDLEEIKIYITEELSSEASALKVVKNIMDSIKKLVNFPNMGSLLSSKISVNTNLRFLVCGNYLVFYRVDDTNIYIVRIIYSRRDYLKIIFD